MDLNELTKKYKITCGNCKTKFTIKYDEEETDMRPMSCPFCSYEFDDDEGDESIEGDENEETSWD